MKIIIGQKFGNLTFIGKSSKGHYILECKCGKELRYTTSYFKKKCLELNKGNLISCYSCLQDNLKLERSKDLIYCAKLLQSKYKHQSAKKRNLEFKLLEIDIANLCFSNCYYCGATPNNIFTKNLDTCSSFKYNGIDRINSSLGYVRENCVPCCIICNRAKSNLPLEKFAEWVKNIYQGMFRDQSKDVGSKPMTSEMECTLQ